MSEENRPAAAQDDLSALRAENERLRSELESEPVHQDAARRSGGRRLGSVALLVVGALLLPLSVLTVWTRNEVLDTQRYLENVGPLASNPYVKDAVAGSITKQINAAADFQKIAKDVLPTKAGVLAAPIAAGAESIVGKLADKAVQSDAFVKVWLKSNELGHKNLVAVLTGEHPKGAVEQSTDGKVVLAFGPLTKLVLQRVDKITGLGLSSKVPTEKLHAQFVLVDSKNLATVQTLIRWLDKLSWIVPIACVLCLLGGALLAPDRRKGIRALGLAIVTAMVVTRLGIGFGREFYLQSVPSGSIPAPAAAAVFDILTRFLTRALRGVFYTGVVLVIVAWLAGPTRPAVWLRRIVSKASGAVGGAASGSADMGAAPAWFAAHLSAIRNTVLVLAGVVLIAWTNPTSTVVAVVLLVSAAVVCGAYVIAGAAGGVHDGGGEAALPSDAPTGPTGP